MQRIQDFFFSLYAGDLGFYVRSIGHFHLHPDERERVKRANFGEIFWCLDGRGIFDWKDGRSHILRPGQVWYYPPGSLQSHRPWHSKFHYRWLSIDGPFTAQLFSAMGISPGITWCGDCPETLFTRIELGIQESKKQMDLLVDAFAILACIAGGGNSKRRIGSSQAARELSDENFRDATLTVSKLACRLKRHRISLNRSFREAYGINLSEYIMSLRRQEALRLIRDSDLPLREVALCSGFSSAGYFIQSIRKITGMTPGELRKKTGQPPPENFSKNEL